MKYIDEYRNTKLARKLALKIRNISGNGQINIMEVCGTHTQSFFRFGLDKMLPGNIRLITGPGCPVCVSSQEYIDAAISLAQDRNNLILTFGDMLRIPGTKSSLEKQKASFNNVRVVYSCWDSLKIAQENPDKKIIFLAVGFETTSPTVALTIIAANKETIRNVFFLTSLKLIPAAMRYLVRDKRLKLKGFLCPGHVSAVIGTKPYQFLAKEYKISCCVAGFEPLDIMEGIYLLVRQIIKGTASVENEYTRIVKNDGNLQAIQIIKKVFQVSDANWRGLGVIPKSGLKIRKEFSVFDAENIFSIRQATGGPSTGLGVNRRPATQCKCGDILKGLVLPSECKLFAKICNPEHPVGPCMVSYEGACSAYFKYKQRS
ncbi:MAG: hydrogenase formation protein HypD [Candidatus Omnitrophica bacterium]|nr:hydrogenase formation protein HypD [Candidatus Omnitrophota bacterium]